MAAPLPDGSRRIKAQAAYVFFYKQFCEQERAKPGAPPAILGTTNLSRIRGDEPELRATAEWDRIKREDPALHAHYEALAQQSRDTQQRHREAYPLLYQEACPRLHDNT